MKSVVVSCLLAFIAALMIASLQQPEPLEDQLLHLQVDRAMPQYAAELADESADIVALLLEYAHDPILFSKARVALLRYPDVARPILTAYGEYPLFQEVLRKYGEDIVLPIHYFRTNEIFTLELTRGFSETARAAVEAMRNLWTGGAANQPGNSVALTSSERGWYAIQFVRVEGYDFLGQFVVAPDGSVGWIQTERVLEGINRFFASGLKGLETRLLRDEAVTAGDVGWAAVDIAIGVSAFKLLRMGRAGGAGGRALSFSERSAALGAGLWRGTVVGSRIVKYGAPAVVAYLAVRHPSLINSLLGRAAETLGLPVYLVQVVGWTLVLLPVFLVLRWGLRLLAWMLGGLLAVLRWSDKALTAH